MRIKSFVHSQGNNHTTLDQLRSTYERTEATEMLACFAYATVSGAARFDIGLGHQIWPSLQSRWLFGIDYGRTEPAALRWMAAKSNAEVRVYDGEFVVGQPNFLPRRDFHMKAAFLANNTDERRGFVGGSGNFSASGLIKNIECGVALVASTNVEFHRSFRRSYDAAIDLWDGATLLSDIIQEYEEKWVNYRRQNIDDDTDTEVDQLEYDAFWIEPGYITKNRGPLRPGNQIDMPRGMHTFFDLTQPPNITPNSVIGPITFRPPTGGDVTRDLRLGNNMMEKITLPLPEQYGLDLYDGKVLLFRRDGARFRIDALEADDFQQTFGSKLADVAIMASGRRYGYIKP